MPKKTKAAPPKAATVPKETDSNVSLMDHGGMFYYGMLGSLLPPHKKLCFDCMGTEAKHKPDCVKNILKCEHKE